MIEETNFILFSPKGELTITTDMEELSNALYYDNVPDSWTNRAYPSLLSLAAWYADLLLRIRVRKTVVLVKTFQTAELVLPK